MRKRLTYVFCLMIMAICGIVGCQNNPYAKLQFKVKEGLSGDVTSVQELVIAKDDETGEYVVPEIDFRVEVSGISEVPNVLVSGWEGRLERPTLEYEGNGVTRIKTRPVFIDNGDDEDPQVNKGRGTLNIYTSEGNKNIEVDYNVRVKLNNFYIVEEKLPAVAQGLDVVLDDVNGFIDYRPNIASDIDMVYSVVTPVKGGSDNYIIEGKYDNVTYLMSDDYELMKDYKYAEVVVDETTGKRILKVYPYFIDQNNQVVKDELGNPIRAVYPRILQETNGLNQSVFMNCITLKVENVNNDDNNIGAKFIDIEVVSGIDDIALEINSQKTDGNVSLNKNENGEYDIVLINNNFKEGVLTSDELKYFTERELNFSIFGYDNQHESEYQVVANNVSPDEKKSIDLSMIGDSNHFKVHSLDAGEYSHKFTIRHRKEEFHGLFDREVVVNFHVIDIPSKITINNQVVSSIDDEGLDAYVYNVYSKGTYGTKFRVNTGSSFGYFVYLKSEDVDSLKNYLTIRRDGDGTSVVFAQLDTNSSTNEITSVKAGYDYARFGSSDNFFLIHQLNNIPEEPTTIYVGITFSMAHSSYTKEVADEHFGNTLVSFPINITFENGISNISLTQSKYEINLDNPDYIYELNYQDEVINPTGGVKLWDLPSGLNVEKALYSINYDESLIKVYESFDRESNVTSLYIKAVDSSKVGSTTIDITAKNGLKKSVNVSTFISTAYIVNGNSEEESYTMPLASTVDKYSSGYLYYLTAEAGKAENVDSHQSPYPLNWGESYTGYDYDSVKTLFMITNGTQKINFYDYRIKFDSANGTYDVNPIDITSQVSITSDYPVYATYKNGVITTYSKVTKNMMPIQLHVTYRGSYEAIDQQGNPIRQVYIMTHTIDLYIYQPLEGVEVTTSKSVDLYVDQSLGYVSKYLSEHVIKSTFLPSKPELGAEWNEYEGWGDWDPVQLRFEFKQQLDEVVLDNNKKPIVITDINGIKSYTVKYSDLFDISTDIDNSGAVNEKDASDCLVKNIISNKCKGCSKCTSSDDCKNCDNNCMSLWQRLQEFGYTTNEQKENLLRSKIFSNNIELVISVYINQFNKLQNINSVRITSKYAERVSGLNVNVADDGVSFAVKNNEIVSEDKVEINYSIVGANAINKNLLLGLIHVDEKDKNNIKFVEYSKTNGKYPYEISYFASNTKNNGKITISVSKEGINNCSSKDKISLVVIPADNVSKLNEDGSYSLYNTSILRSFEIRIADGTEARKFEIKDVDTLESMMSDIDSGKSYYYVITRNIDLKGEKVSTVSSNAEFHITGMHAYEKDGQEIITYNGLYNLYRAVSVNDSEDAIISLLFGSITNQKTTLDNIYLYNADLRVVSGDENDSDITIGLIAAIAKDVKITNCLVNGKIEFIRVEGSRAQVTIGGMIGTINSGEITGLPGRYTTGIASNSNNANVEINIEEGPSTGTTVVGALVGKSKNASLQNLKVSSTITTKIGNVTIGGVVGQLSGGTLDKITVSPRIVANLKSDSKKLTIGGVIGETSASYTLSNTKVLFVDLGDSGKYTWQQKANIYLNAPESEVTFGGLIGIEGAQSTQNTMYNYVRSYITEKISDSYKGNIYVVATSGAVGGIVGRNTASSVITSSYFDGDITASTALNKGQLIGLYDQNNPYTISNSYGIGYIYNIDGDSNISAVTFDSSSLNNGMLNVSGKGYSQDSDILANDCYSCSSLSGTFADSYSVVNGGITYVADNNKIYVIAKTENDIMQNIEQITGSNSGNLFGTKFGFVIAVNSTDVSGKNWLYVDSVNVVELNNIQVSYPVILKDGVALYDLIPDNISVKILPGDSDLYDVSINASGDEKVLQVLMYLKKNSETNGSDVYTYGLVQDDGKYHFDISLNGSSILEDYKAILEIDSDIDIEVLEDSQGGIIQIENNTITPQNPGLAKLTIRSWASKSVKIVINVLVVDGITDYELVANETLAAYDKDTSNNDSIPNIYIDENESYTINTHNTDKVGNNYVANQSFGFIIELLDARIDETERKRENATVLINGKSYTYDSSDSSDASKNIIIIQDKSFVVSGVTHGYIKYAITPFIYLNGITYNLSKYISVNNSDTIIDLSNLNIFVLDNLTKTYDFKVLARARSIETYNNQMELSSEGSAPFTVVLETANVKFDSQNPQLQILEDLLFSINGNRYKTNIELKKTFDYVKNGDKYVIKLTQPYELNYALVNIIIDSISIIKTNIDTNSRQNTYKISLQGSVSFDLDYYRTHANEFDLNSTIFSVVFTPETNESISASVNVRTQPNEIEFIEADFYSSGEKGLDNGGTNIEYPEENHTTTIVPGRSGLLKITLNNEFNNSSYITITLDKSYKNYVTLTQVSAIVRDNTYDNVTTDEIMGYQEIGSYKIIDNDNVYGFVLSKQSLNYNKEHYFNSTYYVKILVDKSINTSILNLNINSYQGDVPQDCSKKVSLTILEMPIIRVLMDSIEESVLGKGVIKPLDIYYKGVTNDIDFVISVESGNLENRDKVYIADENGNKVNSLSIDYLKQEKKYYIYQDVTTSAGEKFKIEFKVQEYIRDINSNRIIAIEESSCNLNFKTVEFEIENVKFMGVYDSQIKTINHGATEDIEIKLEYKDIVVGDADKIEAYKNELISNFNSPLSLAQYKVAGTRIEAADHKVLSSGDLYLYYKNDDINYEKMSPQVYGDITLMYNTKPVDSSGVTYNYYQIFGSSIGSSSTLRLGLNYYYNDDGEFTIGLDSMVLFEIKVEVKFIVKDNSTYDHPIPIETQDDLLKACSSFIENPDELEESDEEGNVQGITKGYYILLNNIELNEWVPQEALFNSLDGNGYTIKINSLNLSSFRGVNNANVGIFTQISEKTLIKNLIIDVSPLLVSENTMRNAVNYMSSSSQQNYTYKENIDLGYTNGLNFGVLAGVNNGAVTNIKVVSTKNVEDEQVKNNKSYYLHVQTTLGSEIESNIGGLVGVNSATGAITNSFVGVNTSNQKKDADKIHYYVEAVRDASSQKHNNENDTLSEVEIYPFILAGGNKLAGVAGFNSGTISAVYAKGLGMLNPSSRVDTSATAGLVVSNEGVITSTFVEGNEFDENNKSINNEFRIESVGFIGGLVYENSATIENSYTNVNLVTYSSFLGGFVFKNNENGKISNAYSTTITKTNAAVGQFTGVIDEVSQNFGTYDNCYYLIDSEKNELPNKNEDALAIDVKDNKVDDKSVWKGFAFATSEVNEDGCWILDTNGLPKIKVTQTDTVSFRQLLSKETDNSTNSSVYTYNYSPYQLGTKENPLIIEKALHFDKYIIDNSYVVEEGQARTFGYFDNGSAVRYVRIVNNLDFKDITTAQMYEGTYLYQVTFAGILDGNGMTLSNLNIKTDNTGLENFGLFAQIGHDDITEKAVVKNLNITVNSYSSNGNSKAGILAGTIVNSSIVNIKLNGNSNTITGENMTGALAGLVYTNDKLSVSLIDIEIENIHIASSMGSFGNSVINNLSQDTSKYFYNSFTVMKDGVQSTTGYSFDSLYNNGTQITALVGENNGKDKLVSYAGAVAGVVYANNYNKALNDNNDNNEKHRTKNDGSTINNIVVSGDIKITNAANAGGLFGYVAENTLIRNSKFVVNDGQLLKGSNYIGGIVGENHGIIEQCTVAYDEKTQAEFDATLAANDRKNGTFNLFDDAEGELDYYVVAIGGIAGYSEDGVIIDSYSKVNVVNPTAFIAGGIIGYSMGSNHLGYVYNTGAVFARDVIGGVIGIQINNYDTNTSSTQDKVVMNNVISLTNWNATSSASEYINIITQRLYNNTNFMYDKSKDDSTATGYYNYYIKMPEVGNAPISHIDGATSINSEYRVRHNNYYIGSVVGKALIKDENNSIKNGDETSNDNKLHVVSDMDIIKGMYSVTNNVISSTLGIITPNGGSVEEGTLSHDYFKDDFTFGSGLTSLSYRSAYSSSLNSYTNTYFETTDSSYIDRYNYEKIFTAQEYIPQIIGQSYTTDKDAEGIFNSQSTRNIFIAGYNEVDRYSTNAGNGAFVGVENSVWGIKDSFLPIISSEAKAQIEEISSLDALTKAFRNGVSGKIYKIASDIVLNIETETGRFVEFYKGIDSSFVGVKNENNELKNENQYPTITINVNDGANIATIFNLFSGVLLQDLNFEININKSNFTELQVEESSYGLVANAVDSAYITNCTFTIIVSNGNEFSINSTYSQGDQIFNAKNVGAVFGSINNSNINNSTINIQLPTSTINNAKVENFGLFAGNISYSTISNCNFEINNSVINISDSATNISVGAIAGKITNSKFDSNLFGNTTISIVDSVEGTNKNIGGLFGSASVLTMYGTDTNAAGISVSYDTVANVNIDKLNIANVIGYSDSSNNVSGFIQSGNLTVNNSSEATINTVNVGSIIGYNNNYSQLGKTGVIGSTAKIDVSVNTMNLNVGGLIGASGIANDLLNNGYFDGDINVANSQKGEKTTQNIDEKTTTIVTTAKTFVGSVLGFAENKVVMTDTIGAGKITISGIAIGVKEEDEGKIVLLGVGGIVGGSIKNIELYRFVSITDFNVSSLDEQYMYISGILGYNGGIFKSVNGYSYVELPTLSNGTTSSITTGSINSNSKNIYYAQEFIGNAYFSDTLFESYAMADLYDTISEYSPIYSLVKELKNGFNADKIGNIQLPVPVNLKGVISKTSTDSGGTRFDLDSNLNTSGKYRVIMTDVKAEEGANYISQLISSLTGNQVLSGRSTSSGKVTVTFNYSENITYFIGTNEGIISNIYFSLGTSNPNNMAIVSTNNGLITNCYVYGLSSASYPIANTNNGRIYQCVTAIKTTNPVICGFANSNNGQIYDCYSRSFAYNHTAEFYGFVKEGNENIKYCAYNIPEGLEGLHVNLTELPLNCYKDKAPKDLIARSAVWYQEGDTIQIKGMTSRLGDLQYNVVVYLDGEDISTASQLKAKLREKMINGQDINLTYSYDFYSDSNNKYTAVLITNATEFISYINGLNNGCIPNNTIVLLTNNITIDASKLSTFSLSETSMLIGVGGNITINFADENNKTIMNHSFINQNKGFISGITLENIEFYYNLVSNSFAPIVDNLGIIYNVNYKNVIIRAINTNWVAGLVYKNEANGFIKNCTLTNIAISAKESAKEIVYNNLGLVDECGVKDN